MEKHEKNGVLTNFTDKDIKLLYKRPERFWKGVTSIGEKAFCDCISLTSITIPEGVREISGELFNNCDNLQRVIFKDVSKISNLTAVLNKFNFDSIEQNGNEATFIRNIEKTKTKNMNKGGICGKGKWCFNRS